MANTLITPTTIARAGIATLYAQTQMAALVHRDFEADFDGKVGDTITIRKPATFTANEYDRATGIVLQDATEASTTLTLDTLLDVSFPVTSEEWTLDVVDFTAQFLTPAMEAISQGIDKKLLALDADVSQVAAANTVAAAAAGTNTSYQLIDADRILNAAKVPVGNRAAVLSAGKTAEYLRDPLFHDADKRGDTLGLREAAIGRKFGFDSYLSQNVDSQIGANKGMAFHRDAFALVSRTLAVPRGVAASQAAVAQYKGLGLRVIYNYDSNKKQDVVSIDVLVGVKTLDATKAVVLPAPTG